jgi:hypothetical protein
MTAAGRVARVVVFADRGADAQDLAELVGRLRAEVVEHEFDLVHDLAGEPVPGGAKAADPAGVDSLLIALAASGGVLTSLIGLLQAWLLRGSARTLVVELDGDRLELSAATSEERRRLTNAWLSRHEQLPGADPAGGGVAP